MRRLILLSALFAFVPGGHASSLYAQGCAQCRDNAAYTPPKTRAAYRHAIILLVLTATTIFTGAVILLKRSR